MHARDRLFSEALDAFNALDATVIGASSDPPATHAAFARKHALLERYSTWREEKKFYGKVTIGAERSTFLIDPSGTVRAVRRKVKVPGHPDAVREKLYHS